MNEWRRWCWNGTPVWKVLNTFLLLMAWLGVILVDGPAGWWVLAVLVILFIRSAALDRDMPAWRAWRRTQDE